MKLKSGAGFSNQHSFIISFIAETFWKFSRMERHPMLFRTSKGP
jgi:hypothetical protein